MQVFNPNDPNVAMLEQVARSLAPELCSQFVFVGGAAAVGLSLNGQWQAQAELKSWAGESCLVKPPLCSSAPCGRHPP